MLKNLLAADFSGITRSELEAQFLHFLQRSSLPLPELNVSMQLHGGWIEPDCLWRRQRLIVELDGHATHGTRAAFERDRKRDLELQAEGWRVERVTWRLLNQGAEGLAADLSRLLAESARA